MSNITLFRAINASFERYKTTMQTLRATYIIMCFTAILALLSCSDDDFTTSRADTLSFSADSVKLDTVFCNISSSTRDFWVFNHSSRHIRLSRVSLHRGNQSGFRVNVDGVELGPDNGFQTPDIEVRSGDSIRVFVELTARSTGKTAPEELEDKLDFALESGVVQSVPLNACSWDAVIMHDKVISADTELDGGKPIVIYGGLTVEEGATLTLRPGTTLYMRDEAQINVRGRLLSLGEPGKEVVMRGYRLDRMFSYLPYDRVSGQWGGVRFYESSYDNRMEYTDLHSAFNGVVVDSCDASRSTLVMNASTVHNCQGYALRISNAKVELYNCQLSNALNDCLYANGGDVRLNNCTLAQFYPFDSARGVALRMASSATSLQLDCKNSLITGYSSREQVLSDSVHSVTYSFTNSLLRIVPDSVASKPNYVDMMIENPADTAQAGRKHFAVFDTQNLIYDFSLSETSSAINAANASTALPTDRKGVARDASPDMGAYDRK